MPLPAEEMLAGIKRTIQQLYEERAVQGAASGAARETRSDALYGVKRALAQKGVFGPAFKLPDESVVPILDTMHNYLTGNVMDSMQKFYGTRDPSAWNGLRVGYHVNGEFVSEQDAQELNQWLHTITQGMDDVKVTSKLGSSRKLG